MTNPQLPSDRYYADQIKNRVNRPLGLKQTDNINPVITLAQALSATASLKALDIRKVIFACIDIDLHPSIVDHFEAIKKPLNDELPFPDFLSALRTFFANAKPIPTQFHDLANFQPSFDTSAALNSALQDFSRDFEALRKGMAKSAAPFELFISKLPDHLRSPASAYLIAHEDCDIQQLANFFTFYMAQNKPNAVSTKIRPHAPVPSSPPPETSPSTTPSTSSEPYCKYCRTYGHLLEDCEKKKRADARRTAAQDNPQSSSSGQIPAPSAVLTLEVHAPPPPVTLSPPADSAFVTPSPNGNPALRTVTSNPDHPVRKTGSAFDSLSAPYIGHPVIPVKFRSSHASIHSHVLPDLGSPSSNLISLDLAKALGFQSAVLPGSTAPVHTSIGTLCLDLTIATVTKTLCFNVVNDIQPPSVLSFNAITDFQLDIQPKKRTVQIGPNQLDFIDYNSVNPKVYSVQVQPFIFPSRLPQLYDDFYDQSDDNDF
jgi:hypothetical protein